MTTEAIDPTARWSFETKQIGRAPFDKGDGRSGLGPLTDSVDALDAGDNAQMA